MSGQPDLSALRRPAHADVPPPRKSWVTRILVPGVLLLAFAALLLWAGREALTPRLDVRTVPAVVKPSSGGAAVVARAAGWIEPEPYEIRVPALTEGVIDRVLVLESDPVEAGQVVARLIEDDARIALDGARAALAAAEARAATVAAEAAWSRQAVPVELRRAAATAAAALEEAGAAARVAQADAEAAAQSSEAEAARLRRLETLADTGIASVTDLAEARATARAAALASDGMAARRAEAQARHSAAESESRAAAELLRFETESKRSERLADAAIAEATREVEMRRAELAAADLRWSRLDVRSPVAGVVLDRLVAPGSRLAMQMPDGLDVVTLYDPKKLQVRVDVPLADAAKIGIGRSAKVTVEALPGKVFDGEVLRVQSIADIAKNTVQAKVRILSPDPAMRPEMLARVELVGPPGEAAPSSTAVFVPERLVRRDGDRAYTWIVADGRASRREVRLGAGRDGDRVEVIEGLAPGDDVIDADPSILSEGRSVRVAEDAR